MKLLFSALIVCILAGCQSPVPSNHFQGTIGGVPFSFDTRKQTGATNIDFTVVSVSPTTTNFSRLHIGSIFGVNDPAVVDKSYAGAAALLDAQGRLVDKIAAGFGTVTGNAARAAVAP